MIPKSCLLVSRSDVAGYTAPHLSGYATTDTSIVFGSGGAQAYLAAGGKPDDLRDGRFVGVFPTDDGALIRADRTGQEQLFLFQEGEDWAVSNSFMLLVMYASKICKLQVYYPALIGFHLKEGRHVGEQLVSHRTAIEQISLVPATTDLLVDKRTGRLEQRPNSFLQEFSLKTGSYKDELLDFLEHRTGLARALIGTGTGLNLFLSGGYDSRLVLAFLMGGVTPENLRVTSHAQKQNDFASARQVTDKLGLPLNPNIPARPAEASASDAMRLWLLSCGCTYLPFYRLPRYSVEPAFGFRLTGDQPTGWDHFHGSATFNGTPKKICSDIEKALVDRDFGSQVASDFYSVLPEIGMDPDHPKAMLAHYWAVRSRHHCGRNWYKSLGNERLVTLLMDSGMVRLDFYAGCQGWSYKKFFADCFSALGQWAIDLPFETPDRSFEPDLLASSPFRGGVEIRPRNIKVYGRASETDAESPKSLMELPLSWRASDDGVREQLAHNFWNAERARDCDAFIEDDFLAAKKEIEAKGALSRSYRKTSHIVMVESLLAIVENSGRKSAPPPSASAG